MNHKTYSVKNIYMYFQITWMVCYSQFTAQLLRHGLYIFLIQIKQNSKMIINMECVFMRDCGTCELAMFTVIMYDDKLVVQDQVSISQKIYFITICTICHCVSSHVKLVSWESLLQKYVCLFLKQFLRSTNIFYRSMVSVFG